MQRLTAAPAILFLLLHLCAGQSTVSSSHAGEFVSLHAVNPAVGARCARTMLTFTDTSALLAACPLLLCAACADTLHSLAFSGTDPLELLWLRLQVQQGLQCTSMTFQQAFRMPHVCVSSSCMTGGAMAQRSEFQR